MTPKLLLGHAYLRACNEENPLPIQLKKRRKRLKLTVEQQWKKGIGEAYRKLQVQRDQQNSYPSSNRLSNISIPSEPLPMTTDEPLEQVPIIPENIIEHEFLAPCKSLSINRLRSIIR